MRTIQDLFQQAQLAEAAYANLWDNELNVLIANPEDVKNALITEGFSLTQASEFSNQWRIVDHIPNTASGFSATLFQDTETGAYTLAVRGSERMSTVDGNIDWFSADLGDIGGTGLAIAQALDLYNYWQSLNTAVGQSYQAAVLQVAGAETALLSQLWTAAQSDSGAAMAYESYKASLQSAGYLVEEGTASLLVLGDSAVLLAGTSLAAGSAKILPGSTIEVTGHSLGGHLALIFGRLFPESVTSVTAFNAPYFDPSTSVSATEWFFSALREAEIDVYGTSNIGLSFDNALSQNIVVEADLAHDVGNMTTGTQAMIFSEGDIATSPVDAHSIEKMVDSLAFYNLLATLDAALNVSGTAGVETITSVLEAISNVINHSLENALDAVRRLFNPSATVSTLIDDREDYYLNLQNLNSFLEQSAYNIGTPSEPQYAFDVEFLTAKTGDELIQAATNPDPADSSAIAYRYALMALNPFAVTGVDYQSLHNANGELDRYDPETREGALTQQWIEDRAAFLTWKNLAYAQDRELISGSDDLYFEDPDLGITIEVSTHTSEDGVVLSAVHPRRFLFGGEEADSLVGANQSDRLHGMGGTDVLNGRGGNDYLEGGAGLDVYQYSASESGSNTNDGADTIFDADGSGVLRYHYNPGWSSADIDTVIVDASVKLSDSQWQSADGRFTYDREGADLRITVNDAAGGSLLLKDWREGDFNIHLLGERTHSQSKRDVFGDREYLDSDPVTEGIQPVRDDLGNYVVTDVVQANRDNVLYGDRPDAPAEPDAPGEHIVAGGGHDTIFADSPSTKTVNDLGNADWIEAGEGRDDVAAGAGNDYIEGGFDGRKDGQWGGDLIDAGAGDDTIFGDYHMTLAQAVSGSGFGTPSGLKGDFVSGGAGDDWLIGWSADDALDGGGGTDLIIGGAGDDNLWGDKGYAAYFFDWSIERRVTMLDGKNLYVPVLIGSDDRDDSPGAADTIYGGDGDDWSFGGEGDDFIDAGKDDDLSFGEAGNDTLIGGAGNDVLIGDNQGYMSAAEEGGDYLDGGAGDDILQGDGGDDILIGGPGTDVLIGGAGKDTYVFDKGDGTETVTDIPPDSADVSERSVVVVLSESIKKEDVKFRLGSLMIDFGLADPDDPDSVHDAIHFEGFNVLDPWATPVVGEIHFADGSVMTYDDILAQGFDIDGTEFDDNGSPDSGHEVLAGTAVTDRIRGLGGNDILAGLKGDDALDGGAGDDQLQGGDDNDTLYGGSGNDALFGQAGNDLLEGGAGFDYLAGDEGDDTYIFDAQDTVYDASGSVVVQFRDDQAPVDIDLSMQVFNGQTIRFLRLSPSAGGDPFSQGMGITLGDGTLPQSVSYAFADGNVLSEQEFFETSLTNQQILYGTADDDTMAGYAGNDLLYGEGGNDQLIGRRGNDFLDGGAGGDTIEGEAGNDRLFGQDGDDTLNGGAGNDELVGGQGSDIYLFARGDGNDVIHDDGDTAAVDMLRFAADITPADITLTRLTNGDLRIALTGAADTVTVSGYYNFSGSRIEQIEFDDGTVIDSAMLNGLQVVPIAGSEQNDVLSGTRYSDTLLGLGGDDVLDGGQGDDTLEGGSGSDSYVLAFGSGTDAVIEEGIDSSEIRLGSQVRFEDLAVRLENGSDLRLLISGTSDGLIISDYALASERWSVVDETGTGKSLAQLVDDIALASGTVTAQTEEAKYLSDARAAFLSETHGGGIFHVQYQSSDASVIYRDPPYGLDYNPYNADGSTLTIEKITGGASDNIFDNSYSGPTVIEAGEGNDLVWAYGWGYNDTGDFVDGGAGDDRVFGTFNNDVIMGGEGDDYLAGGDGNDTYVVLAGDTGFKVIDEAVENISLAEGYGWNSMGGRGSTDTIVFGPGIAPENLAVSWGVFDSSVVDTSSQSRSYDTMDISWGEDCEIRVVLPDPNDVYVDMFRGESHGVEFFEFADGTVLTLGQLMNQLPLQPTILGAEEGDTLFGTSGADVIAGFGGNDSLIGREGNDVLDGGGGDDYLSGDEGNDTYRFYRGAGVDMISNYDPSPNSIDTLRFGPDIAPTDVIVSEDPYGTVYLSIPEGADRVRLSGFGIDAAWALNSIEFSDGTIWDANEVLSRVTLAPGTDYRDFLAGGAAGETIQALGDIDEIYAGAGDDYVDGGAGDDYIEGNAGNDILLGGEGSDDLEDWEGNTCFDAGVGDDYVYADDGAAFVIGGAGNDYIDSRGAATVVAFNAGDGQDTVYAKNPIILSVGAGIDLANLSISQSGQNIMIDFGGGDSIELTRRWEQDPQAWPQITLQVIGDKVRTYDLSAVVGQFESLQAQDPNVTSWQFGSTLQSYELGESAASAYGGDLAYDYARFGSTDRLSTDTIQALLADPNLGLAPQALILPHNQAPSVAIPIADQIAEEDTPFSFAVPEDAFADLDVGDTLTYAASLADGSPLPGWLAFDPASREFSGTAANDDVGTLSLRVTATDAEGLSAFDTFDVAVMNINDAPMLLNPIADQTATEDAAFNLQIVAGTFGDVDAGDGLAYHASLADGSALPAWLTFDAASGILSGTPTNEDVGAVSIRMTATDTADASASDVFEVTVVNTNDAPTLASAIAGQTVIEDMPFTFMVPANSFADVDVDDTLTYTASLADGSALPAWISFDPVNRTFIGMPGNADVGTLRVEVTATDSANASAVDVFEVTVVNINDAPRLASAIADQSALEDTAFTFQVPADSFADPDDGDSLIYSASLADGSALPAWLIFDAATCSFSGTPSYANAGTVSVRVVASDGDGLSVSDTFDLTVNLYPDLVLTGDAGDDTLIGHSGNDILDGGLGADTMMGAQGDDIFLVDDTADFVIENPGEGTDLVQSSLTYYTLPTNIEDLTLTGSAASNGTGNALDNRLVGNDADNILRGGGGIDTLSGEAGNDTLYGGAGADTLAGGLGDDNYILDNTGDIVAEKAAEGSDTIRATVSWMLGANVENLILAGTAAIDGQGSAEANLLIGNSAVNTLGGAAGNDILQGLGGNDMLIDASGTALFDGGAGDDSLNGNTGNEMFIGGTGNDMIATGSGADLIVFNLGDGQDAVAASSGADNTLSLGGGIVYGSLTFTKSGNDLVLNTGSTDKITFADWYSAPANRSVASLQVIAEAMPGFNPSGSNPLLDDKVEIFDFAALTAAFDAAGQVNGWALSNALLSAHLSGSDTEAIGGDLAYQYGKSDTLSGIGLTPAQEVLNASQFGSGAQTLRPIADLQQGQIRLS